MMSIVTLRLFAGRTWQLLLLLAVMKMKLMVFLQ
jgi:hypothetical protein